MSDSSPAARLARRNAALARRAEMSPSGPAPDHLRVATWNLNSLKQRLAAVDRFLERARPDVLCLQETKAPALTDAARHVFDRHGYEVVHVGANAYNGVAIAAAIRSSTAWRPGGSATSTSTASPASSPPSCGLRMGRRSAWLRCTCRTAAPSITGTTTTSSLF